ncbi:DNA-3-methyladenine glycosylase family protein [Thermogladius sp. 4427co]|uniref:DNA-3-methyladenine glycosylase family protein n=1 Tax=Thermogladius sp. 4427co TaxID=3450718 RepID=UPI003F794055
MVEQLSYTGNLEVGKPADYNFYLTASVYNFSFWFNGETLILPIGEFILFVRENDPVLKADIYSPPGSSRVGISPDIVKHVLGLSEDLRGFYELASKDPLLSDSIRVLAGMHFRAVTPWLASLVAVCQQNASFKQGWRMYYNIIKAFGKRVRIRGLETYIPPEPGVILRAGPEVLRATRIGYRARTVTGLAELFSRKPYLNTWDIRPVELEEELSSVKGVGEYTKRLVLALSLRYYGKPPIDRWLRKIASVVYGVEEESVEEEYVKRWGNWSGLAALYTTVALDAEPLSTALERIRAGLTRPDPSKYSPLTLWKYL